MNKNMIIFIYKKRLSSEKTNDPVCVLVSKSNKPHSKCILHQKSVRYRCTNPMMSKPRSYPLIERLNAIITSSFSSAASSSSSSYGGKKCGADHSKTSTEQKSAYVRSTDATSGLMNSNGMNEFEYEDFSLDSLDSIFEDSPMPPSTDMNSSTATHSFSTDAGCGSSPISSSSPFCMNTKDDIKDDFNYFSFPSLFHGKPGLEYTPSCGHPFFQYPGSSSNNIGMNIPNFQPNTIGMNAGEQSTGINHGGINASISENMLELQPPPFPQDTLQSPVTDMPGFEWCSSLDWTENSSYDNSVIPSLPYSAYHTHSSTSSAEINSTTMSNTPLGSIPPLELITPLTPQDDKCSYPNYQQDLTYPSSVNHSIKNDLNILGVDLNNLMHENSSSSSNANARLLTDLTKTSFPINDNHFTPPPSPTDSKLTRHNHLKNNNNEHKFPRKRIVISKCQLSTSRKHKSKFIPPREIKANHMDFHDYTNKVQYTKTIPIKSVPSQLTSNNPPDNGQCLRQLTSYAPTTPAIEISPSHKNSYKTMGGIIDRVEDLRRKISEIDDPEYLAHGTGIPR